MMVEYCFCPYCGSLQTEEQELLKLMEDVYILHCRACDKDGALVLYDGIRGSVTKANKDEDVS